MRLITGKRCFNEAEAIKPRKPADHQVPVNRLEVSFNEAEAIKPRKLAARRTLRSCARLASMRPRQSSLGNLAATVSAVWVQAQAGFNEAEAIKPRKLDVVHGGIIPGYGFNEAEAIKPRKPACGFEL